MATITHNGALAEKAINQYRAVQKPAELAALIDLFADEDFTAERVLEVGTDRGGTLWLWCKLATADATLVTVDLDGGPWSSGTQNTPELLKYASRRQSLHVVRGDSHSLATQKRVRRVYPGRTVDLLFLDGDHSFDGVAKDYWTYSKLVRPGGFVVLHDIAPEPDDPSVQVADFWQRIRARGESWEILTDPSGWGGFGVLRIGHR